MARGRANDLAEVFACRSLRRPGTRRYFRDQAFHFQTLRALDNVRADGADTAEVLETIGHIREGDVRLV